MCPKPKGMDQSLLYSRDSKTLAELHGVIGPSLVPEGFLIGSVPVCLL